MPTSASERLASLLNRVEAPLPPCVQLTAKASDLRLEVTGLGRIRFPVPADQARELITLASPARFGRGEKTLTDPKVRDTWEVPRKLVRVTWTKALTTALDTVRQQLGLPPTSRLVADLHSLLVYEPGQFFLTHQDSEKHDTMIGTLVVTLPTPHTGGELVIHHGDQSRTHRGWKSELALVAFHADRRHEVLPVRSGYRIALTYNLLVEGEGDVPAGESDADDEQLAQYLTQHFTTRVVHPYRDQNSDPPRRLVYLLDHEYTERGLSWSRLKGGDIARASRLRTAAARSGCDSALALADIQEIWDAHEPEPVYRRHYRYEEPARERDQEEYELQSLIDSSVNLTHWVDEAGTSRDISLRITDAEVCASTPSAALQPYSWQYEGYMGNWGNTLDRWYRRAAVVVWPQDQSFAIRAEAAPSRALEELLGQVKAGDLDAARTAAATLAPFWDTITLPQDKGRLFATALRAAAALDDPQVARLLVRRFPVEELRVPHMAPLAALAARYGDAWVAELMQTWFGRRQAWSPGAKDRVGWLASLPALCSALLETRNPGTTTAARLLELSWDSLRENLGQALAATAPSRRAQQLAALGDPLATLLAAVAAGGAADLGTSVIEFCRERSTELTPCLMTALRAAAGQAPNARRNAGFDDLASDCVDALQDRLTRPERADDDWSLTVPVGCTCELCETLGGFLLDPARRTTEWRLAKPGRQHIHGRIDAAELPVGHSTRRSGSPYTLVLTKEARLLDQERQARHRDQRDLEWLTTEWDRG